MKRRSSDAWLWPLSDEIADLFDSLTDANAGALDHQLKHFGLVEVDNLSGWSDEAIAIERETFVVALSL